MPIYLLGRRLDFPPAEEAQDGLVAVGGDLRPERLLRAYRAGIFPWYGEGDPILWHSPDPRFVLPTDRLHVPRRLGRTMRSGRFRLTVDTRFDDVVAACASAPRPEQDGTWITPELRQAYGELHRRGYAHSIEAWAAEGELAGGVYGVSLGGAFFAESMFRRVADASKVALVRLVEQLHRWRIRLVDCQMEAEHLLRFGAEAWPRQRYLAALGRALEQPTRRGRWRLDDAATEEHD